MMRKIAFAAALSALALINVAAPALAQAPQGPGPVTQPPAPPPPLGGAVLKIKQGEIQGFVKDAVAVFRGLPYAAPPVGELRWREPASPASWSGVRPANAFGGACNQSEDCLYLNVFAPEGARASDKLPVLFWIHGGGFAGGSGAGTDGSKFVKQGIVVVSINYRLGRAGWFAHPALTAENPNGQLGNYGFMDQIAALKWVKDNIPVFGGDPNNVTIAGGSAGAISVNYLMQAPQAQGLFSKAISESGFGRMAVLPIRAADGPSAEANGKAFAEKLGITGSDAAAAKALRSLTFQQVLAGAGGVGAADQPKPMADGVLITGTIEAGFAANKEAKIPYILSSNSDEASLTRRNTNVAERFAAVKDDQTFLAAFDPEKTGDQDHIVARLITDQSIREPDRALARLHSAHGAPTYVAHWTYVPEAQRATAFGMGHGAETAYVFNTPRQGQTFDPEAQTLAASANSYWAAFVRTGDPGAAGGAKWPKFDRQDEAQLEFPGTSKPVVRKHLDTPRFDWVEAHVGK